MLVGIYRRLCQHGPHADWHRNYYWHVMEGRGETQCEISRCICCKNSRAGSWWRHQMETVSALLALCAGNSPVIGEFPAQRPVTRSFDVFFHLSLNKQSYGWWFETPSCSLWRHCNGVAITHWGPQRHGRYFTDSILNIIFMTEIGPWPPTWAPEGREVSHKVVVIDRFHCNV